VNSQGSIIEVDGVSPSFIFDKFIYQISPKTALSDSLTIISTGNTVSSSYSTWYNHFQFTNGYTESQRLYNLATTSNSFVFLFSSSNPTTINTNTSMVLHTSYYPFKSGSSMTHCDQAIYTGTQDFLMRPEAQPGYTLSSLTSNNTVFPVGPLTRNVLSTMGYSTKSNPSASTAALYQKSNSYSRYESNGKYTLILGILTSSLTLLYLM